jgi:hypothetical protein
MQDRKQMLARNVELCDFMRFTKYFSGGATYNMNLTRGTMHNSNKRRSDHSQLLNRVSSNLDITHIS